MHPEQKKIYQSLTPEQKLNQSLRLYYSAWNLKAAGLRQQHPELSEESIQKRVKEIFFYART